MIQSIYTPDNYVGNGTLDTFAFTFRILVKADLVAMTRDTNDVETTLELNSDYTISDADVNTADGGDVVLTDPLPTGTKLFLIRRTAQTQLNNIEEGSPFPAAVVTKEFDRLTMMIQDLQYQVRQSLKFSPTSEIEDSNLPEPEAGALLQWNSDEDGLQNVLASSLGLTHTVITQAIAAGAVQAVITHNLASASAKVIGFSANWGTGFSINSQDADTITIDLTIEAPTGGGTITTEVAI
jgi:hypothetical protein